MNNPLHPIIYTTGVYYDVVHVTIHKGAYALPHVGCSDLSNSRSQTRNDIVFLSMVSSAPDLAFLRTT